MNYVELTCEFYLFYNLEYNTCKMVLILSTLCDIFPKTVFSRVKPNKGRVLYSLIIKDEIVFSVLLLTLEWNQVYV